MVREFNICQRDTSMMGSLEITKRVGLVLSDILTEIATRVSFTMD